MQFTKMQGAGNDFIVMNNIELKLPLEKFPQMARRLCQRGLSIGGNALMVVDQPTAGGDFKMRFYNADGSVAEMCGNGARCIARYAYESKLAGESMKIETEAGDVFAWRKSKRFYKIKLNTPEVVRLDYPVEVDGKRYECSYVELGNPGLPHAVVRLDAFQEMPHEELFQLGSQLRWHSAFPKGANVNFYKIVSEDHILEKTFERGVEDFTLACGTGSGSVVSVLALQGKVSGKNIKLTVPGGELFVDALIENGCVESLYLTGDTNIVAAGEILDEDLLL
ncbi:diaminopimelate epimerase [Sinanaerobacter sp. ZZT-01]|uniref:diaminopimelate epimerase n=1 Tax=Sinanaerobacter sp. ZZT-01 TaxID=3111540 RepID=UPI002D797176|nr:diaminopimelate epimerase [Sinanaerobacter sp. ZZT-01]WRR94858.1 diaminopimelate epimerase [Sinanaerobacter sp. ZZT-01]